MWSPFRVGLVALMFFCFAFVASALAAPQAGTPVAPAADLAQNVILDTYGFWRMHHTLQPPVIEDSGKRTPITYGFQWMDMETPPPPAGWNAVAFDDHSWLRGPARMSCRTPYLSRLCMRGYFAVTDLAKVGDLTLTLIYQGGAAVYLNGKEVARGHLAAGKTMADSYPIDAFVDAQGKLLRGWDKPETAMDDDTRRRVTLRTRTLRDIRLPKALLRQGTNVLAIEIVRTSYPPVVDTGKVMSGFATAKANRAACLLEFNTCELTGLQLKASTAAGLETGAVRLGGLRVWNGDIVAGDFDLDFGGQGGEPLHPVRIVAVRNGAFSGKFVVGSTDPIRALKVTLSDLSAPGGATIPAAAVQLRYGRPWGEEIGAFGLTHLAYDKSLNGTSIFRYVQDPKLLGALWDAPPAEIPVAPKGDARYFVPDTRLPPWPSPVAGAVAPVWLTVRVPKDAVAGEYTGRATVQAEGAKAILVPVQVKVVGWTLPDPDNFTTWMDMIQSPDTLSLEYNVPLWSDEHWKLIDRTMDLLHGVGNRVLYVPLIAQANLGNAESMVRWIDRETKGQAAEAGGGKYEYDFSVMDKYLDHALKHMGKPAIVVLYAWDIYFAATKQLKPLNDDLELPKDVMAAKRAYLGKGPMVTVVDPATGKTEARHLPLLTDPESKALWQGLFAEVRKHLQQRGLWDRVMLGTMSDAWPSKAEVDFYTEVAGDLRWFSDSHMGIADLRSDMEGLASGKASPFSREKVYPTVTNANDEIAVLNKAAYSARVWSNIFGEQNQTGDSLLGWKNPEFYVQHDRHANIHPMARWHFMPEENIIGKQRGLGRLGGDWWSCVKDKNGRRVGVVRERYPQSMWRNLDMNIQTMAPGPDGAVATHRFENLREGLQECEARIFIEKALADAPLKEKLGADLARKAQDLLRRRANLATKASSSLQMGGAEYFYILNARGFFMWPNIAGHCWWLGSDWQQANEDLFTMAASVAAKIGS